MIKCIIARRETPFFNYFLTIICSWKHHFNYKNVFATRKWHGQLIFKIVNDFESTLHHNWKQRTHVNLWVNVGWQHFSWKQRTFLLTQHFNYKILIRCSWLHACKSMDELHPPTCHVIWGCGSGIMIIFQLYYN